MESIAAKTPVDCIAALYSLRDIAKVISFFSRLSRRVAGTGWKALPANFVVLNVLVTEVCGMWFTVKGWLNQ
jgi:hypothetical protein